MTKSSQLVAVRRALFILGNIDAEYRIKLPNGKQFTRGKLGPEERKQRRPRLGLAKYFRETVKTDLPVGEVISLPYGKYGKNTFRSNLAAYLTAVWGKGNYKSSSNGDAVDVMRVG